MDARGSALGENQKTEMNAQQPIQADLRTSRPRRTITNPNQTLDRLPPHAPDAEEAILGCILLDPIPGMDACLAEGMKDEWFYDLRNREVWATLVRMQNAQKPIDMIGLTEALRNQGQLEAVGGLVRVCQFCDKVPSAANLGYYLEILREKHTARHGLKVITEAITAIYESEDSPGEVLAKLERKLWDDASNSGEHKLPSMRDIAQKTIDMLEARMKGNVGLMTGYYDLDNKTCGMQAGEMWVLAGRPSTGKTSLAMGIAEKVAWSLVEKKDGGTVVVFSLEMSGPSLIERILAGSSRVDTRRMDMLSEHEKSALGAVVAPTMDLDGTLIIDDTPGLTISKLCARARRHARVRKARLIVIDYLQLIQPDSSVREENRRVIVDALSTAIKNLARELNIPILALAQLNREFEKEKNRKPRLADLRESGQIEQDADFVGMLYDAEPGKEFVRPDMPKPVNLRIVKQRNGMRDIDVQFLFFPNITRFESKSPIAREDVPTR